MRCETCGDSITEGQQYIMVEYGVKTKRGRKPDDRYTDYFHFQCGSDVAIRSRMDYPAVAHHQNQGRLGL